MDGQTGRLMTRYVAFPRAINVAGHGRIRMAELAAAFEEAGFRQVRTCIQSGNVVVSARRADLPRLGKRVHGVLSERLGNETSILYRSRREFERVVEAAPFEQQTPAADVKHYVCFLERKPRRRPEPPLHDDSEALTLIGSGDREAYVESRRKPNGFYGFPNKFVETTLGVRATSRNWNTVRRIADLLAESGD